MKNFFSLFWQSISDFDFYKRVINFSPSAVFKYFLILLFILCLSISLGLSFKANKFIMQLSNWAVESLPAIYIDSGVVNVDAQMPFVTEKDNLKIIIDTTGQTLSIGESVKRGILLTDRQLIYKQSDFETNAYDLSGIKKFTLNKESIERLKKNAFRIAFPLIFLAHFIYYALAKTLQILLFSLLPLVVSGAKNMGLKYNQVFKISVFALTLPFALAALAEVFSLKVKFFYVLFVFVYSVYLAKGTLACRQRNDIL
jgi:hypothetical protein